MHRLLHLPLYRQALMSLRRSNRLAASCCERSALQISVSLRRYHLKVGIEGLPIAHATFAATAIQPPRLRPAPPLGTARVGFEREPRRIMWGAGSRCFHGGAEFHERPLHTARAGWQRDCAGLQLGDRPPALAHPASRISAAVAPVRQAPATTASSPILAMMIATILTSGEGVKRNAQ